MLNRILFLFLLAVVLLVRGGDRGASLSATNLRILAIPVHLCHVGIAALMVWSIYHRRRLSWTKPSFPSLLLVWIVLVCLSTLLLDSLPQGFLTFFTRLTLWALGAIYAYSATYAEPNFLRDLRRFFCLFCIILCLRSAFIYISHGGFGLPISPLGDPARASALGEASTVNAYLLLWCTPLLYFWPKQSRLTRAVFFVSLALIVLPAKRGVLVTLLTAYGITFAHLFLFSRRFPRQRWRAAVTLLLAALVIGGVVYRNRAYYNTRITTKWENWTRYDRGFTGREEIWAILWNHITHSSVSTLLVGSGFCSTTSILDEQMSLPSHAHNDWLDTLVNMGLIGVVVLLLIHLSIIRQLFRARQKGLPFFHAFLCSYLCLLPPTMFSTTINSTYILCLYILIGHFMGLTQRFPGVPHPSQFGRARHGTGSPPGMAPGVPRSGPTPATQGSTRTACRNLESNALPAVTRLRQNALNNRGA